MRLGFVYLKQNKVELAVPICERALILAQGIYQRADRAHAHLNLARAYYLKKDEKRALEHLEQAIEVGLTNFGQLTGDKRMQAFLAKPEVKRLLESARTPNKDL